MGISLNVDTNNENEFNQQLQLYLAQGYSMQSNINGTAILKKKSYSVGLLIVLILFFFPAAIIYYLVASDDVVTIRNNSVQTSSNNNSANTEEYDSYCVECGQGLFEDSKFCPGCGRDLNATVDDVIVETDSEENVTVDEEDDDELKCNNCGTELTEESLFCPECGEKITQNDRNE